MKPLRQFAFAIALAITASVVLCANEPSPNSKTKLTGVWVADSVTSSGKVVPSDKFPFELHFGKDKLVFRFVGDIKGDDRVHTIVVDDTKDPATLDITSDGPRRKGTVLAIYKFDNDRLLIYSLRNKNGQPSENRPTAFGTGDEVGSDLLILKPKPDQQQ